MMGGREGDRDEKRNGVHREREEAVSNHSLPGIDMELLALVV